ncbi:MAG TPA: phosphotransferase [Polyangiaceae bacterium]|nr:phosphotransferase [Polyangiaceae bacterium]
MPLALPAAEVEITPELVARLLREQHPDLANLPLGTTFNGWDNVCIRLGADHLLRLPRRSAGASLIMREIEWLPRLSAGWSFRAPVPERAGVPGAGYPWHWSIVPWIEGELAHAAPLDTLGARELGRALAEIHQPAGADAPRNEFRSPSLAARTERLVARLRALEAAERTWDLQLNAALELYADGAARGTGPRTFAHLDLHASNVLTRDGHLAGILDWGDCAAAQPEADLGQAFCLIGGARMTELIGAYVAAGGRGAAASSSGDLSADAWARTRSEALMYAAFLASIDDAAYSDAGWAALNALGVARRR